jgi:hypothetical protein
MDRYKVTEEGSGKEKQHCVYDTLTHTVVARYSNKKKATGIVSKANDRIRTALYGPA